MKLQKIIFIITFITGSHQIAFGVEPQISQHIPPGTTHYGVPSEITHPIQIRNYLYNLIRRCTFELHRLGGDTGTEEGNHFYSQAQEIIAFSRQNHGIDQLPAPTGLSTNTIQLTHQIREKRAAQETIPQLENLLAQCYASLAEIQQADRSGR